MIRKITHSDAKILSLIHRDCFDDFWSIQSFEQMLNNKVFEGFIYDKIGAIFWKRVLNEIEIVTLCVKKTSRQSGVGKKLLAELIHFSQKTDVTKIFLEVSVNNLIAKTLYLNAGFKVIYTRAKYYKERSGTADAILMEKEMSCKI